MKRTVLPALLTSTLSRETTMLLLPSNLNRSLYRLSSQNKRHLPSPTRGTFLRRCAQSLRSMFSACWLPAEACRSNFAENPRIRQSFSKWCRSNPPSWRILAERLMQWELKELDKNQRGTLKRKQVTLTSERWTIMSREHLLVFALVEGSEVHFDRRIQILL